MSIYEYDEERQRIWDREEGKEEGRKEGKEEGIKEGENRFAALTKVLLQEKQTEKLLRATEDKAYREILFQKYNL